MAQEIYTDNFGNEWLTDDCLTVGDYGGAGSVGAANLRWLEEKGNVCSPSGMHIDSHNRLRFSDSESSDFSVVFYHSSYSYKRAFIRLSGEQADAEIIEATQTLENYPLYDEQVLSEIECEWEEEAWEDYIRSDLLHGFGENLICYIEDRVFPFDFPSADSLYWECYREAMEEHNEYPEPEYMTAHVDTDKIKDTFKRLVLEKLRERNRTRLNAWRKNWLALPMETHITA